MTVLTDGEPLDSFLNTRFQDAVRQASHTNATGVDRDHLDDLAATICGIYGVERLELQRDKLTQLPSETVNAGFRDPSGQIVTRPTLITTYRLPYTGTRELWNTVPNGKLMSISSDNPLGPVKVGGRDHLLIYIGSSGREAWQIKNDREQVLGSLATKVGWVNEQVDAWNHDLRESVRQQLLQRIELAEHGKAIDAASDVPIFRAPSTEQVPIPLERKILRPVQSSTAGASGVANSVMEQAIYEDVVQTIEQMSRAMERTPTVAKLSEEEIRNLILFVLNANYRGAVSGEVFNGKGKTDILLRWDDANAFIGECKFWKGSRAFRDAIDQMLGYVTWRDTKAALIIFIRGGQVHDVMAKARRVVEAHETCESESVTGTATRYDYVLRSKRDADQKISVALIGVVVPESGVPGVIARKTTKLP